MCVSHQRSGAIALGDILAAEKVEEKSFGSAHVMQVVYVDAGGQQETAYLQCKVGRGQGTRTLPAGVSQAVTHPHCCPQCVNELNQWLSALRKVCVNNPRVLRAYHPGVFRGDKWSCCHQRERTGTGGGHPGLLWGCPWGPPATLSPVVPQGRAVTRPTTVSRCRTGATPWTPPQRLSASSTTSSASGGPSGETPPRGDPPCTPLPPAEGLPIASPREKYWELLEPKDAQNGPRGEGRSGVGGILGTPLRMLWLGHVHRALGALWCLGVPLLLGVGLSLFPPTGAPLPEGLSRLLGVLGDLERCHRLAQPPAPPAPALLQLQT